MSRHTIAAAATISSVTSSAHSSCIRHRRCSVHALGTPVCVAVPQATFWKTCLAVAAAAVGTFFGWSHQLERISNHLQQLSQPPQPQQPRFSAGSFTATAASTGTGV